jgi:asparagine synthase (glutamine-hydrolysing)
MHSFYRLIGGKLKQFNILKVVQETLYHKNQQSFTLKKSLDVFSKSILSSINNEQTLYELELKHYFPFLLKDRKTSISLKEKTGSRLNNFLYHLMFEASLPSILHYEDRNSMAFSIESRVPFLDHRLVEFAFSLPDEDKIHKGETKYILRQSMKRILPESIANRKDKKGFVTPGEIKWLRGQLRFLIDEDFRDLDFIRHDKAGKVLDDFRKGENKYANLVWRLAVLNYWVKKQKY